jgi:hypothetical protein
VVVVVIVVALLVVVVVIVVVALVGVLRSPQKNRVKFVSSCFGSSHCVYLYI